MVRLLKISKNHLFSVFFAVGILLLFMIPKTSALSTEEIINKIENVWSTSSSCEKIFIDKVLKRYLNSYECFKKNKHKYAIFTDLHACESFKYLLMCKSFCDSYDEYSSYSADDYRTCQDEFMESLGEIVNNRSETEKRFDEEFVPEFFRFEIFVPSLL